MSTSRVSLDKEMEDLNCDILRMGAIIEQQIREAVESLTAKDIKIAETVIDRDDEVDRLQEVIEDKSIEMIIRQQPIAKDLRTIFSAVKLATDLERISDIAVNIARIAKRIIGQEYIKPLVDIPRMAKIAQDILRTSLDSYVKRDVEIAKSIVSMEEEIDHLYARVFEDLIAIMTKDASTVHQGVQLIMVARQLERIGDHSTNIGEMAVYLKTGERIKLNN